jgi:hypothetical protein
MNQVQGKVQDDIVLVQHDTSCYLDGFSEIYNQNIDRD